MNGRHAPSSPLPTQFGDYRLLRKLAQGGMAEIFLAQDRSGDFCAVKRILPHLAHEEGFIRMFIDEARIVSHLDHPNIAGVYDQGRHDGFYYIAMEFVQGHSLLSFTERAKATKMSLQFGLLSYIVAELLGGLGCAHSARDAKGRHLQIVHRDVTPQNVLISYGGEVKLIDFGVAKARARLTHTEAGFTKGKLSYMSPEQARGETLDGRSDLFSVGIILHEVTTNRRLFNKEGPGGILGAIVNDPIPLPTKYVSEYPSSLEAIVMKALEKGVDQRWQTAEEMREALLRFARQERPTPGPARLRELILDLFGPPDSQEDIDLAQSNRDPTPARVAISVPSYPDVSNDRPRKASSSTQSRREPPRGDETQMLRPEIEVNPSRMVRDPRHLTRAGTPAVQADADDFVVPEPERPLRVRVAEYLAALSTDVQVSWRTRRRRWLAGIAGLVGLFIAVVGAQTGLLSAVSAAIGGAAEQARSFKTSAGLSSAPETDAGLRPTVLVLRSRPPGAAITINSIGMGAVTPHALPDLPTGKPLRISLSLPGFHDVEEKLVLAPDGGTRELTLTLAKKEGAIQVGSKPEQAHIYFNGEPTGHRTPHTFEHLAEGRLVTIQVRKDEAQYRPSEKKAVLVVVNKITQVSFVLTKDPARAPDGYVSVVTSPKACQITVDGQRAGTSPLSKHALRPGLHEVAAECEYHARQRRAVTIAPGDERRVSFALQPNVFGWLTVNVVPADSQLRINGRQQIAGQPVKVVPGQHVVEVINPDIGSGRRARQTVTVRPEQRVARTVTLR